MPYLFAESLILKRALGTGSICGCVDSPHLIVWIVHTFHFKSQSRLKWKVVNCRLCIHVVNVWLSSLLKYQLNELVNILVDTLSTNVSISGYLMTPKFCTWFFLGTCSVFLNNYKTQSCSTSIVFTSWNKYGLKL